MWILKADLDAETGPLTFRVLAGTISTIGRARRADFVLDAAMVSRLHCRLTATQADSLEVLDLKSTNGTYVNGRRVARSVLRAGDRLTVGRVEFTVEQKD